MEDLKKGTGSMGSMGSTGVKTCEEYVLAELEKYRLKAELAESYAATLKTLKEIFVAEEEADGSGLKIGVRDELLDIGKDPNAAVRIVILKQLFGTGQEDAIQRMLNAIGEKAPADGDGDGDGVVAQGNKVDPNDPEVLNLNKK